MTEHKNPVPTVDIILQKDSNILLVKRKKDPFKDHLALPGGFVNVGEKVEDAVKREAVEETSLEIEPIDILGVYSDPGRDPRGHILSIVFVGTILSGEPKAGDDSQDIEWVNLGELEKKKLAFDHGRIIADYIEWRNSSRSFWSSKHKKY
jgi:ADP-ribose pyrophosphatase YjhB (NUDIX family)